MNKREYLFLRYLRTGIYEQNRTFISYLKPRTDKYEILTITKEGYGNEQYNNYQSTGITIILNANVNSNTIVPFQLKESNV